MCDYVWFEIKILNTIYTEIFEGLIFCGSKKGCCGTYIFADHQVENIRKPLPLLED